MKIQSRIICFILAIVMVVGFLPLGQVAYAAEFEFTTQPQSGTAPKTGSYTFTWEVSGTHVDVVLQKYRTSTSEWVNETSVYGITSYTVTYNENISKYRLKAQTSINTFYYSNEITVTWTGEEAFRFTTQPQSGTAPKTGSYTFTWALDEMPDDAVWQEYRISTSEWVNITSVTDVTSKTVTYNDNVSKYRIMAKKGTKTIYSDEVTVTWTGEEAFHFTTQPESGTAPKTGSYTFTWALDETPDDAVWQEYRISTSEWINVSSATSETSKTVTYSDNVSKYRVKARKGSKTIYSNEVTVTWTGEEAFRFTTQPESGTAPKTGSYTFTWALDETPTSIILQQYNMYTNTWGNTYSLEGKTSWSVIYNENVSKYRIAASKGDKDIYSAEFTVTWTDDSPITYNITVNSGSADVTTAAQGATVTLTADAASAGKEFDKWSVDSGTITLEDVSSATTTFTMPAEDVKVTAKYKDIVVTAISIATPGKTAYTVGDSLDVSGMEIKVDYSDGSSKTIPVTAAMVSGFDSSAAAASQTLTITYEGKTTTYNVSISAVTPTTLTVTFNTNGGSAVASQTVADGSKAVKPDTDPTKEGCTFDGWYQDATFTAAFDFNTAITADTTIYAKWTESTAPGTIYYTVVSGANGTWTEGDIVVTVKRSEDDEHCIDYFTGVKIDDKDLVNGTDYTAVAGSTVVTIKGSTLESLSKGGHTITVTFKDGTAVTSITLKDKASGTNTSGSSAIPSTGETTSKYIGVAVLCFVTSGALFGVVLLERKKRKCAQ